MKIVFDGLVNDAESNYLSGLEMIIKDLQDLEIEVKNYEFNTYAWISCSGKIQGLRSALILLGVDLKKTGL